MSTPETVSARPDNLEAFATQVSEGARDVGVDMTSVHLSFEAFGRTDPDSEFVSDIPGYGVRSEPIALGGPRADAWEQFALRVGTFGRALADADSNGIGDVATATVDDLFSGANAQERNDLLAVLLGVDNPTDAGQTLAVELDDGIIDEATFAHYGQYVDQLNGDDAADFFEALGPDHTALLPAYAAAISWWVDDPVDLYDPSLQYFLADAADTYIGPDGLEHPRTRIEHLDGYSQGLALASQDGLSEDFIVGLAAALGSPPAELRDAVFQQGPLLFTTGVFAPDLLAPLVDLALDRRVNFIAADPDATFPEDIYLDAAGRTPLTALGVLEALPEGQLVRLFATPSPITDHLVQQAVAAGDITYNPQIQDRVDNLIEAIAHDFEATYNGHLPAGPSATLVRLIGRRLDAGIEPSPTLQAVMRDLAVAAPLTIWELGPELAAQYHVAAYGDPLSYGTAESQLVTGTVPIRPGEGTVRIALFIPQESAGLPLVSSHGDDRTYSPYADPTRSRAVIEVDYETGEVTFLVNPSCGSGQGPPGECHAALPVVVGGNGTVGHEQIVQRLPWVDDTNRIDLNLDPVTGELHVWFSILNSDKHIVAPAISGEFSLTPDMGGGTTVDYNRDHFPALEVYHYPTDGSTPVIIALDDEQIGAAFGLIPFPGESSSGSGSTNDGVPFGQGPGPSELQ